MLKLPKNCKKVLTRKSAHDILYFVSWQQWRCGFLPVAPLFSRARRAVRPLARNGAFAGVLFDIRYFQAVRR
jgi:hypothetical protein